MPFSYPKPESKLSTGSQLLDQVLGLGQFDPASLAQPMPMVGGLGGLIGSLSRYAQGTASKLDKNVIRKNAGRITELAPTFDPNINTGSIWDFIFGKNPYELRELITQLPEFNRFRETMQKQVRQALGDKFPLYRGITSERENRLLLGGLESRNLPKTMAMTPDLYIAKNFRGPGLIEATATPESVLFREPWQGLWGKEKAVVVDPSLLLDFVLK